MKTDSLFYRLFQRWPELALDLAGVETTAASRYVFRSEEIKQTAFRLDGVLTPPEDSDGPWVFVEVQFQPDDTLYRRLFAEIFLYLHRTEKPRPWRAVVLYPDFEVERVPVGYANVLALPEVRRVDLGSLCGQDRPTPGWELLRIVVEEPAAAFERARCLLSAEHMALSERQELLDFIETILVYKLPRSTREEIQTMLGVTDIDFKQTRFYKDVLAEGREEGEAILLKTLLNRRFGPLPDWVEIRLKEAKQPQLEQWAVRLLDAENLEVVFHDR